MSSKAGKFSRRDFIKTAGAMGIGSILSPVEAITNAQENYDPNKSQTKVVPTRPFGKTGVNVSILGLGGAFNRSNQLLLKQAVKMGVTYWDTAEIYGAGLSEMAIGKYFQKFPEHRKKIFLVTKPIMAARNNFSKHLELSLERLQTSYIDLYLIHMLSDISWMGDDIKAWAEKAKAEGKIRFFGFSTHNSMEKCMLGAVELGWIDGIMTSYNYRLMHTDSMKRAVDACIEAGIGLTAMKTQAEKSVGLSGEVGEENETALKLTERFIEKGYTFEQAKLKAVWENPNIACICSYMTNMTILQANVEAALSKTVLSSEDKGLLGRYARETAPQYCAGCAHNCEPIINYEVPISNVMRYLMYNRSYGEYKRAKNLFKGLPSEVRKRMANFDYRDAENVCPQRMPIGKLMREAVIELA
jgi:predicted aldo/keto reductase-like oxidoreductase